MVEYQNTLTEIQEKMCLWCPDGLDATELVRLADNCSRQKVPLLCCDSESVHTLWGWLENSGIKIIARFSDTPRLPEKINAAFKRGADGAVLIGDIGWIEKISGVLGPVREDLFFGKKLFFGTDLLAAEPFDWDGFFFAAKQMGANGLILTVNEDPKGRFVGKTTGFLDSMPGDFSGSLLFHLKNMGQTESAWRLTQHMRPDMCQAIRFLV